MATTAPRDLPAELFTAYLTWHSSDGGMTARTAFGKALRGIERAADRSGFDIYRLYGDTEDAALAAVRDARTTA